MTKPGRERLTVRVGDDVSFDITIGRGETTAILTFQNHTRGDVVKLPFDLTSGLQFLDANGGLSLFAQAAIVETRSTDVNTGLLEVEPTPIAASINGLPVGVFPGIEAIHMVEDVTRGAALKGDTVATPVLSEDRHSFTLIHKTLEGAGLPSASLEPAAKSVSLQAITTVYDQVQ